MNFFFFFNREITNVYTHKMDVATFVNHYNDIIAYTNINVVKFKLLTAELFVNNLSTLKYSYKKHMCMCAGYTNYTCTYIIYKFLLKIIVTLSYFKGKSPQIFLSPSCMDIYDWGSKIFSCVAYTGE